jgi:predicted amidohydrolase
MIRAEIDRAQQEEFIESHVTVLIGINAANCASYLKRFQTEAGITQFIDAGDANKDNLAKLAAFVSQSISSTSQAIGTGGPSQSIAATI